jgi:hypothetical protein
MHGASCLKYFCTGLRSVLPPRLLLLRCVYIASGSPRAQLTMDVQNFVSALSERIFLPKFSLFYDTSSCSKY